MSRSVRALVVDDSRIAARVLTAELQEIGFEARASLSLDAVQSILQDFRPDVVLTDLQMPQIAETEICPRLREVLDRGTLIWIFSGVDEDELSRRAAELGADGHLSKTIAPEEMRVRLKELLRRLQADSSAWD
jgi:DNA-binding response OmpR family regulator